MIQLPLQYGCHRLPSEAVEKVRGLCPARGNPLNVTFLVKIEKKFDFEVVTALRKTHQTGGILEPDGRKLFPPENQRTIIDHKGTQAWAEYFPSGILATPGHQLLRHLFVANSCHDSASASIWLPSPPIRSRGESSWPVPCTRESTQCDVFVVTRLVELYNRKGPLPKTKGQIRIFVLEVQTILLGILEPDGRKLFPPENQRTIIDHKGTQAWAEYFPSGILATPGHHFRFNMAAIASHPKPWKKVRGLCPARGNPLNVTFLVKIKKKFDFEVVTALRILEPDGRKLFPSENQRTIIDHKGTQAWAEYFPSGILATPGHQLLRHLFVANSCHDSASASIWLPSPPIRSRGESSWPVPCTRESTQCDVFGILEPDGRKLFPSENQRTIIDHKGTQAWAEYFPSGILATPGHQLLRHLFVANSCHDSASASIWLPSPPIRSRGESSWPVPCTRESTQCDVFVVTRLVELYNRKGPLPKTKGQIRIFVLEVQTILLGILEPDGRKLFPPENQRTIIDHKSTQAWPNTFHLAFWLHQATSY
ncbi:hypothetical protein niasHT_019253 [Heterodera trifolii]|uniref:Uncharacterized protein n=1 Tax=Heterodera trifolii TaxID=157864 RepID=A0ABD2L0R8_9BILA